MYLLPFKRAASGLPKNARKVAASYGLPLRTVLSYKLLARDNVLKWHALCKAASSPYHVAPAPKEVA